MRGFAGDTPLKVPLGVPVGEVPASGCSVYAAGGAPTDMIIRCHATHGWLRAEVGRRGERVAALDVVPAAQPVVPLVHITSTRVLGTGGRAQWAFVMHLDAAAPRAGRGLQADRVVVTLSTEAAARALCAQVGAHVEALGGGAEARCRRGGGGLAAQCAIA
jgi:hypothetical protein